LLAKDPINIKNKILMADTEKSFNPSDNVAGINSLRTHLNELVDQIESGELAYGDFAERVSKAVTDLEEDTERCFSEASRIMEYIGADKEGEPRDWLLQVIDTEADDPGPLQITDNLGTSHIYPEILSWLQHDTGVALAMRVLASGPS